ncbi:MAG: helix-hairpin-helix domain-containing protein [Firmicutes bacterium]|nr:helix-hairpin-helix domain-containing protein [Bacillota bacterium]
MKKIELKSLKNFDDLKRLLRDNKELIKTAALPLIIGAAVLFFWFYGADEGEIEVENGNNPDSDIQVESDEYGAASESVMYVDISGEVITPGVYEVYDGTRLFQVIEMAGGLTENADVNSLNQAEIVYDGQKIIVSSGSGRDTGSGENADSSDAGNGGITNGKVNLNLADSATLQTIPGIGPSKADRIIEYRNNNGRFRTVEDIMNITGIGQKTFESIKSYITV